jgi:phospholipid/cholesterol/gamma-HCH transport system ATP-binding protein
MPAELSGGMRKRIALARTLILKPEIILYDEPTSGLDTITAREISELMLSIQKKYKTTSIVITHDMDCAKLTGKRIMILKDGVIHAEGTYSELKKSKDEWVRSFFI